MKLHTPVSISKIANLIDAKVIGNQDIKVLGFNEIHVVDKGDIMYVDHPKYYQKAIESNASVIIINKEIECPSHKSLLLVKDPFKSYNYLTNFFRPFQKLESNIGEETNIHETSIIQPNVTIGNHVKIGNNCLIQSGVVIYDHTEIGDNVVIHANSVIGADAFYYQKRDNGFNKMHSCGKVVIEDNVEIGSTCTIDRGVSGITLIGKGTKIDNQVHVGHDTKIGKQCLIAAQVGIAGCCNIKDNVTLWGQVGIPSDITIGESAILLGQSAPMKNLEGGKKYFGSPAMEAREQMKLLAYINKLPKLFR